MVYNERNTIEDIKSGWLKLRRGITMESNWFLAILNNIIWLLLYNPIIWIVVFWLVLYAYGVWYQKKHYGKINKNKEGK